MAKKKVAEQFNMSEVIREMLKANPKSSSQEVADAIMAKYPGTKINKNSFSVAFYTSRKKLFGSPSRKPRGSKTRTVTTKSAAPVSHSGVDIAMLQSAAKFVGQAGSAEAAMAAIKQVQSLQVK